MNLIPIVLSGGSGTRLWPVSRANHPKQFSQLLSESLQAKTLKRLQKYKDLILVTSLKHKVLTDAEIATYKFPVRKIIFETEGKNTAPAIALACKYLEMNGNQDSICGVFASDALITNEPAFHAAVDAAIPAAANGQIVTLGIKPERIETGFGYIQIPKGVALNKAVSIQQFHEKPSFEKAGEFIKSGNYFWNAGIFIFKVSAVIELLKKHAPEIWAAVDRLNADFSNLAEIYKSMKSISFDYAVMEKLTSDQMSCVPCDIGWSDLGSWDVLEQLQKQNSEQISIAKKAVQVQAKNNMVFSTENKVYSFAGIDDLVVVDTADALLVCKKGSSQLVKDVVEQVKLQDIQKTESHPFESRPWGQFATIKDANNFKSKVITVHPGQKLSYQSHQFRSEHWIIVSGSAEVILDDKSRFLKKNDHVFIPQGAKHRIINTGSDDLEFVEVQLGSSFAEEDIIRYQDDYGRA